MEDIPVDYSSRIGQLPTGSDQLRYTHEKKHKKGLPKVPKKLKGFMDVSSKKIILKSPKKDKREKIQEHGDLSKFLADGQKVDKTSDTWKAFEQMNARAQETMAKTQENFEKLGPEIDETVNSVKSGDAQSPWGLSMPSEDQQPTNGKVHQTVAWEGFEDTFEVTPNIELSKQVPHLNVSPAQSPQHAPLPPYNSRRTSLEGLESVGDLLSGLDSSDGAQCVTVNLLGLDTAAEQSNNPETVASITADIMALSRNPQQSDRSSTNPSPVPDDTTDGFICEMDDFLGVGVGHDYSKSPSSNMDNYDPFGLGIEIAGSSIEASSDLFFGELDDDSDLFTVPDVDELIAKHTADQDAGIDIISEMENPTVSVAKGPNAIARPRARSIKKKVTEGLLQIKPPTKKDIQATLPKIGEFDPRSENDVIAKPAGDIADLWDSPSIKTDNPFDVDLFATEQAAQAYVDKNLGKNPFADDSKSKNPFSEDYVESEETGMYK